MSEEKEHDIFLSYNHGDEEWVTNRHDGSNSVESTMYWEIDKTVPFDYK